MASFAVQRASRGCSTNGSALDIRRSLDRDPQPVQQDDQDHDPGIEVTTRSRHNDRCPPSHVTSSTCGSTTDSLLSDPNDSGVLAPPDTDQCVLKEDL
ncbi:uncharacterized protein F5147DRAFT_777442 [Suillus discolor]|uniref:Uncharacterized protein n=1 Tax=Suillus discolor TaxID=1912936 RepID=A0A9P7F0T9_9AGAM|nr:uncharacterized protein F5147DRAFT_777442 [Suillus discolor]KAG2098926.1 hypothetical protein F5147DRAFT_777442 [Suillus discolor]